MEATASASGGDLVEVLERLLLGIRWQPVGQVDQNADDQSRDQSQHKEHDLSAVVISGVYIYYVD